MSGLFCKQAVEAQRPEPLGTVRLITPVSHQVWAVTAAVLTISITLFLCLGRYTRRERVDGSLEPLAGLLNVAARAAGTVSTLDATPGMRVRAGEPLLTISGDQSSAALGDTDAAIGEALAE